MSHADLIERAVRWLYGTKGCNVVLAENASCAEVPDAIGWSTSYKQRGSIVVECKTSLSDFHADKKKYLEYKHPEHDFTYSAKRLSQKEAKEVGYIPQELSRMGKWRYYLTFPHSEITPKIVEDNHPDHGLLYVMGGRIKVAREAIERPTPDLESEIRLLQFGIVHIGDNLLAKGCTINMRELTKFRTGNGIQVPATAERQEP